MEICGFFIVSIILVTLFSKPGKNSRTTGTGGNSIRDEDLLMGLLIMDDLDRQSHDTEE